MGFGILITIVLLVIIAYCLSIHDVDFIVIAVLLLLSQLVIGLVMFCIQVSHIANCKNIEQQIVLKQQQIDITLPRVLQELNGYPQYEKSTLAMFTSKAGIVVLPPKLTANSTIVMAADEINKASDKIFGLRGRLIDEKVAIEVNRKYGCMFLPYVP